MTEGFDNENDNDNDNENDNDKDEQNKNKKDKKRKSEEPKPTDASSADPAESKAKSIHGPSFAAPEIKVKDLSNDLMRTLPRSEGELVRCRRISGNHYRCNWWGLADAIDYDNPNMGGMMVTTHRVLRSRMIRATQTAEGIVIENDTQQ